MLLPKGETQNINSLAGSFVTFGRCTSCTRHNTRDKTQRRLHFIRANWTPPWPTRRLLNTLSKKPLLGGGGGWSSIRSGDGPPSSPKVFNSLKHSVSNICKIKRRRKSRNHITLGMGRREVEGARVLPLLDELFNITHAPSVWKKPSSYSSYFIFQIFLKQRISLQMVANLNCNSISVQQQLSGIGCQWQRPQTYGTRLILPWNGNTARVEFAIEGVITGIQVDAFHRGELLYIQNVFTIYSSRLEGIRWCKICDNLQNSTRDSKQNNNSEQRTT